MKARLSITLLVLVGAVCPCAKATPYSPLLNEVSNAVVIAFENSTDVPKVHVVLGRALKDFQRPSTSVAGDFKILSSVATHLAPLEKQPPTEFSTALAEALGSAFSNFIAEATTRLGDEHARIAALSDYQRLKKAASNQVWQAERALQMAQDATDVRRGLASVRLGLSKMAAADRVLSMAEARPGAPDSLGNVQIIRRNAGSDPGVTTFYADGTYTEEDHGGTYTYTRTGLNTATFVMVADDGGQNTGRLTFNSAGTAGTGKGVWVDSHGETGHFSGTFMIQPFTP